MKEKCIEELAKYFKKYDIHFEPTDGKLTNVKFFNEFKMIKIHHDMFYRHSGMCSANAKSGKKDEKGEDKYHIVPLTDEDFYGDRMKRILQFHFKDYIAI